MRNSINIKTEINNLTAQRDGINRRLAELETEFNAAIEFETKSGIERGSQRAKQFNAERDRDAAAASGKSSPFI